MRTVPLIILCAVLAAAVQLDASGTHLVPVLLGMALVQGVVLVVAAVELSNGKWLEPVRRPLLAFAPLLFLFPFLVRLAPYPWLGHETRWLRPDFFLARNVAALLVLAAVGVSYARRSLAARPSARKWAVAYILAFALVQTMVAGDWMMSLDYPWVSTMFPALYMVECFYAGLVLLGVICFLRERRAAGGLGTTVYDGASLSFGFALFWGGLTFAQYLTIWYGNLPEEVRYFTLRFGLAAGVPLFTASIGLLFVVPFGILLVHRARKSPAMYFLLGVVVLLGLLVSRLFQVLPHLRIDPGFLAVELVAMLGIVALTVRRGLETPASSAAPANGP